MDLLFNVLKYIFGSWQLGLAALLFLLLFPFVFILASLKPKVIRKKPEYAKTKAKSAKKTASPRSAKFSANRPGKLQPEDIIIRRERPGNNGIITDDDEEEEVSVSDDNEQADEESEDNAE